MGLTDEERGERRKDRIVQVAIAALGVIAAIVGVAVGGCQARIAADDQADRQARQGAVEREAQTRGAARLLQQEFAERVVNIRSALERNPPSFAKEKQILSTAVEAGDRRMVAARLGPIRWASVSRATIYVARYDRLVARERGVRIGPKNKDALETNRALFEDAAVALEQTSRVKSATLTERP